MSKAWNLIHIWSRKYFYMIVSYIRRCLKTWLKFVLQYIWELFIGQNIIVVVLLLPCPSSPKLVLELCKWPLTMIKLPSNIFCFLAVRRMFCCFLWRHCHKECNAWNYTISLTIQRCSSSLQFLVDLIHGIIKHLRMFSKVFKLTLLIAHWCRSQVVFLEPCTTVDLIN